MVGFKYHGKSTEDIIGTPLLLVSYESDDNFGSTRSKVEGDATISRPITNEYGTLYDSLSFSYALIKQNYEPFTEEEQVKVERWLTSPKLSSELIITNCDSDSYSYFGLFTVTEWIRGSGNFAMCKFTFQVNGAYPYIHHKEEIVWNSQILDNNEPSNVIGMKDDGDFSIYCYTDELEEYVYPLLIIKPASDEDNVSFKLTRKIPMDSTKYMLVNTEIKIPIYIDCKRCKVYAVFEESPGEYSRLINLRFKDLNWADVDNIYWPSLMAGENEFHIEGHVIVYVDYYAPYKKVGGWLV